MPPTKTPFYRVHSPFLQATTPTNRSGFVSQSTGRSCLRFSNIQRYIDRFEGSESLQDPLV